MTVESIDEGLALLGLDLLTVEEIPRLSLLFMSSGCDVLEMAALAHPQPDEHPSDLRRDLRRAIALAGRAIPDRLSAARDLLRLIALRGSSGKVGPRETARAIIDLFHMIEAELPDSHYVGESFGISALVGLYYSYDDIPFEDTASAHQIDLDLVSELSRLANDRPT